MAKFNGTTLLMYSNGTLIAAQKNCTVNWEQNLPDATSKDSAGWSEHINGERTTTVDFEGLFSTTGLNSVALMGYITGRTSILCVITGSSVTIVGEVNLKTFSIKAPKEESVGLSGSFTYMGGGYMLVGESVRLFNNIDNGTFNTFTESATVIASAIASGGAAAYYATSDIFSLVVGDKVKVFTYLTLNSGLLPSVVIVDSSVGVNELISDAVALKAGANFITLNAIPDPFFSTASAKLKIYTGNNTNFVTTAIYCFKA